MKIKNSALIIFLLALSVIIIDCRGKPEPKNRPPKIYKMSFSPSPAIANQDLLVVVDFFDKENDPVVFTYRWYRDGKLIKEGGSNSLEAKEVKPDSVIYVELSASDGVNKIDSIRSEEVSVKGVRPVIKRVWITPEQASKNSILRVEIDCPDCEEVEFYYRWRVNNELLEGAEGEELSLGEHELKKRDQIVVEVAMDFAPETWYPSNFAVIVNQHPEVIDQGESWVEDKVFYYQFRVKDPDGDRLNYELVEAPRGASLNQAKEMVSWTIPDGFEGEIKILVRVKDPEGAFAELGGSFNIKAQ